RQTREGGHCLNIKTGAESSAAVVMVKVMIGKTGSSKAAKCLFDTGANVSLVSEKWLNRCGYRVDGDDSRIPTGRRANRLENALVKADQPLEFTVFGGQKFVVTHYIVLKTCALRGEGRKFNQNLTTQGYVTYWVTRLLKADV
ncbi:hypothetical protein ADUPG1_003896, partial [Aduncisulcus paluster]